MQMYTHKNNSFIHRAIVRVSRIFKNNLYNVSTAIKKSICWCAKIPAFYSSFVLLDRHFLLSIFTFHEDKHEAHAANHTHTHKAKNTSKYMMRDLMCTARPIVKIKLHTYTYTYLLLLLFKYYIFKL